MTFKKYTFLSNIYFVRTDSYVVFDYFSALNSFALFRLQMKAQITKIIIFLVFSMTNMTEECFNCRLPFDEYQHKPMFICKDQHFCCKECSSRLLEQDPARCPICMKSLSQNGVVYFRQYLGWLQENKQTKVLLKKEQTKAGLLPDLSQTLRRVLNFKFTNQEEFYRRVKHMAESLFEDGKNYAAIVLLKGLIERSPDFQQYSFVGLGSKEEHIGFSQGKPLSWFKDRNHIKEISAEDLLSHILMLCPEYDETEWYQTLTLAYSSNFKLLYGSAVNKHNRNDLQGALIHYKRVIELNPNFSKAYCMTAFLQQNKSDAQKFANMCLERQPRNPLAKYFLALRKRKEERLASLLDIFERQPEYLRALKKIGDIYFNQHQQVQALEKFNRCTVNQYYLTPFLCIASCKYFLGRQQEAIEYLQNLLENELFTSEKSHILYLLGIFNDDQQTSIMHLKQSLEIDPSNQKVILKLASVYSGMDQHQYALKCYQKALKLNERSANILASMSQCYFNQKKHKEMIPYLRRWKEIEPQNIEIDLKLGQAYFQLEDWQKSLEHFLVCTREEPYNAEINMKIIDIYTKLEDAQKVLILLRRYLQLVELPSEQYDCVTLKIRDINRLRVRIRNSVSGLRQPNSNGSA